MGQLTFTISPWNWKASISSPIPSINLAIPSTTAIPLRVSTFSCLSSKIPRSVATFGVPARDRVVDFGKYKGKMLGSLPSTYLKWVSRNLRAGDMEEWAKMADQVLGDPIYRDRMEWEAAEKILTGDTASHCSNGNERRSSAVSELLDISERFGWDNEDKRGWSRIDFGLLGTSKGGRIPRLSDAGGGGILKKKREAEGGGRRKERRERMRMMMMTAEDKESSCGVEVVKSPFPGREALLKKVVNRRQGLSL